jgi:dihydroorotate dehydrogenase
MRFPSPIGIAGGFDKNATMMPLLAALGFGFIEVGTVTLRPQAGNPRPRLFRYPREKALINRMGFNNDGADAVAARLKAWERSVPTFVNVGKNRDVPLEGATGSYVECYRRVAPHADAAVLNLSSPNTPGLRDLQRPEHLEALLLATRSVRSGPILIKIAPDLDDTQIAEICDVCVKLADGMICTNRPHGSRGGDPNSATPWRISGCTRTSSGSIFSNRSTSRPTRIVMPSTSSIGRSAFLNTPFSVSSE